MHREERVEEVKKLFGKASCIYMAGKTGVGESQEL